MMGWSCCCLHVCDATVGEQSEACVIGSSLKAKGTAHHSFTQIPHHHQHSLAAREGAGAQHTHSAPSAASPATEAAMAEQNGNSSEPVGVG